MQVMVDNAHIDCRHGTCELVFPTPKLKYLRKYCNCIETFDLIVYHGRRRHESISQGCLQGVYTGAVDSP